MKNTKKYWKIKMKNNNIDSLINKIDKLIHFNILKYSKNILKYTRVH